MERFELINVCELIIFAVFFCRYNFKLDLRSVPLISPFNYAEWKLNMVSNLESHDLLDVSFVVGKESYEEEKIG